MKFRNRAAVLLAIPALTLSMAACAGNDDETVVTDAPETDKATEAIQGDDSATTTTDGDATTTTTQAPLGDGEFTPVRCSLSDDRDELEIKVGDDDNDMGHVDIDIRDPEGAPVLDGLDIDTANLDIEIDDENAEGAVVSRDGDKWTITGAGKYDDEDRTDEVRVEVICPVN